MADGVQQWGLFNGENNNLKLHAQGEPGDEDLMDLAAYQTLEHAGTIYILKPEEVPGGEPLSAILRF